MAEKEPKSISGHSSLEHRERLNVIGSPNFRCFIELSVAFTFTCPPALILRYIINNAPPWRGLPPPLIAFTSLTMLSLPKSPPRS
jgi:hypothetical protein